MRKTKKKSRKTNKHTIRKKHIRYGGVKATNTTTSKSYNTMKNNKPTAKTFLQATANKVIAPFVSTEGEDNLEASISFLLELLGSTLYETYVDEVLNMESKQTIEVINVPRPGNPPANLLVPGKPKIFYGSAKGTHFTCTLDGINVWNSYKEGIQVLNTDHFCQTFVLMRVQNQFLPDSFVGSEYNKLQKYQYLDNAMVALNVACYVIELLQKEFDIDSQVSELLALRDKMGNPEHRKNPMFKNTSNQQLITKLLAYCRSITKEQICASTFKQKIFLL